MKSYGFTLERESKHLVWRNAQRVMVTTSSTPSDTNALRQVERQIRRKLAAA
jgi:hypothetical protein